MHPTIDIHTHILPEHLPDWTSKYGYSGFVHLEHEGPGCACMMIGKNPFRKISANSWDPLVRIQDCDSTAVQRQVLSTVPVLFHYWAKPEHAYDTSRFLNDHIAQVVGNHPTRFFGLGTVPLQDIELSIREMQRCKHELKLHGIEIGSHVESWNLNDERFFPFYAEAEQIGAALFVHPWDMMGKERMSKYWLPWLVGMPAETSLAICSMIFGGIFEKFPKLRVAFAHGGGSFPATFARIQHGWKVRPDLVAVDNAIDPEKYIGRFWLDSLVHDVDMLRLIVQRWGANRVALGSDYPYPLGEHVPGTLIRKAGFDPVTQDQLLQGAALSWLNGDSEAL